MSGSRFPAVHLARRFLGSLRPGGPAPDEEAWVATVLGDGELGLWRQMSGPDRRHAVLVARRTQAALGAAAASRPVLAAALLHDVGKTASGLGTLGRVAATLAAALGRPRATARIAAYRDHPTLGADLLAAAGSDPLTVAWARQHHLPPERWTLPAAVGRALKDADDLRGARLGEGPG